MKALVVGGTSGQVARELQSLDSPEFAIVAQGRPHVDLTKPDTLSVALDKARPGLVINCGAYTSVDQAEQEPQLARAINADGPAALGAVCAAFDIPLIHISTDYVFDGTKTSAYVESDTPAPQSVYGATKLDGESAIMASSARHVILRISWVHAPQGKNFVRTMLRLAQSRDRLGVVADQIGRPTYAPHLAIAIRDIALRLLLDSRAPTGIFHLTGSGEPCSWRQFAEAVFTASQLRGGPSAVADPITTSAYPTLAKRPSNSVLDCRRITDAYGLVLPAWKQGVEECVEAIRTGGWRV